MPPVAAASEHEAAQQPHLGVVDRPGWRRPPSRADDVFHLRDGIGFQRVWGVVSRFQNLHQQREGGEAVDSSFLFSFRTNARHQPGGVGVVDVAERRDSVDDEMRHRFDEEIRPDVGPLGAGVVDGEQGIGLMRADLPVVPRQPAHCQAIGVGYRTGGDQPPDKCLEFVRHGEPSKQVPCLFVKAVGIREQARPARGGNGGRDRD